MTDEAVIQGTYADLKLIKTRKVAVVCVEIPIERVPELIQKFGMPDYGAEVPVAVARLDPGSSNGRISDFDSEDAGSNPAPGTKPKSYAQRAGILSNDAVFWKFIELTPNDGVLSPQLAAEYIREFCSVTSRRDLIEGTRAGRHFKDLLAEFEAWKLTA